MIFFDKAPRKILLASVILLIHFSSFAAETTTAALPLKKSVNSNNSASDKMSFYFQDIGIRTLLQLIAKKSGLNFIISDIVKGNTTLNLKDVTWEQALDVIMKSHGLAARRSGNVMYISTIEDITTNETKQLASDKELSNLAPLESTIIQLKYSNAKELAEFLKGQQNTLLTSRGQVAVDLRTNSIIIRDIKTNVAELKNTIKKLDVPAKQVLIEARIVTINTAYISQLGVKFGVTKKHFTGTLTGSNTMQTSPSAPLSNIPLDQRLNFNNAASQLSSGANPGSIGLALARLGDVFLDLELSAIEEEGHGQIIASPHVIASNQQKAKIQTGEEIPYQEATASGATAIAFKKAVLSLEITPQITSNNKIILHLKASQNSRGQQTTLQAATSTAGAIFGPPAINSQEVESDVLLNNGETIVIGGIYRHTKSSTIDRVPFFGSLPIVGNLFRKTAISNERNELLIFVTPKIINTFADYIPKAKTTLLSKDIPEKMEA